MQCMRVREDDTLKDDIKMKEVLKVIQNPKCGKAKGIDGITAEYFFYLEKHHMIAWIPYVTCIG